LQEQWVSAKNQRDLDKINLLNALSLTEDSMDFVMRDTDVAVEDFSNGDLVQELLERNPAYLTVMAEIKLQEKNIEIARSGYLPTLNGSYSWSTFYNKSLGKDNVMAASFSDQFNQNKNQSWSLYFLQFLLSRK